ncbi:hypothetical protein [Streptomyces sp. NPDC059533]|uniref:hypothetical protein n=1 Tax=unclassified Streptomyces TaxID=2593676 RepID=UPI0036CB3775
MGRGRALWWALSGWERIAVEDLLPAGALLAAGWRAGHLGLVQAGFALTSGESGASVGGLHRAGYGAAGSAG